MQQIWLKYRNSILFPSIIIVAALIYFIFSSNDSSSPTSTAELLTTIESTPQAEDPPSQADIEPIEQIHTIVVDVKGAVKYPGIFELTTEHRIMDAIEAAGGYTENANPVTINHAQKLVDEMIIYVPEMGEDLTELPTQPAGTITSTSTSSSGISDSKININKATETDLTTLPGIGPSKATAIITYRDENGGFQTIEDLKNVSGIGEKTFERLKELITVN